MPARNAISTCLNTVAALPACAALALMLNLPTYAQDAGADAVPNPAPANDDEDATPPGDLFGDGGEDNRGPTLQIDPNTPQLIPGTPVQLEPSDPRVIEYRIHADKPGLLTLMLHTTAAAEINLRGPNNALILDEDLRQADHLERHERFVNDERPSGNGNLHLPTYRLVEPGEYLIRITQQETTDQPTHLGAGLITLPEGWFDAVPAEAQPGPPGNPEKTAVALQIGQWTEVAWAANRSAAWVKFKAEQQGLYHFTVRPDADQDTTLSTFIEGQLGTQLQYADNDPLGRWGKESIVISAAAGSTYYIMIEDLGEDGGSFRGLVTRLPDELPQGEDPPKVQPDEGDPPPDNEQDP